MRLWRAGLTGLVGALAGMVLFPRPAQGRTREPARAADLERAADPESACAAPDRGRR